VAVSGGGGGSGPRRSRWRRIRRGGCALLVAALVIFLLTPTGCYLTRAGWEEARILRGRKPITRLVQDSTVDARTRAKLSLVLAARAFAVDSVGLVAKQSFTTFTQLRRDTLVLLLSAAHRDRLERHTWWFPIVGRVPYKGYFDFDAAQAAARELAAREMDVYLRPASAFSTLGWFNDPLLSTTLREDSVDLANTVIHELTHNTFYAPGQAVFNESFANFVGARGASWFFRVTGDSAAAAESEARWADETLLADYYQAVYVALDSAFRAHPASRPARLAARDTVFARAREMLVRDVGPRLRTIDPRVLPRMRLDNSVLLARRVYLSDLHLFDAVYAREGRDLRRAMTRIVELAKRHERDPYGGLRAWLTSSP
jgi:predicted aminopeptidase